MSDAPLVKLGVDAGQNVLKVALSVVDGCTEGKKKDSGQKRTILLAIVPGIQENYENLKIIYEILKLDQFAAVKLYNLMTLSNGFDPGFFSSPIGILR